MYEYLLRIRLEKSPNRKIDILYFKFLKNYNAEGVWNAENKTADITFSSRRKLSVNDLERELGRDKEIRIMMEKK